MDIKSLQLNNGIQQLDLPVFSMSYCPTPTKGSEVNEMQNIAHSHQTSQRLPIDYISSRILLSSNFYDSLSASELLKSLSEIQLTEHLKAHNRLKEVATSSNKIRQIAPSIDSEPIEQHVNEYQSLPTLRESINNSIKLHNQLNAINFYEALSQYSTLDLPPASHTKRLWKSSMFAKICSCFNRPPEIEDSKEEILEKLIGFAYSALNPSDSFHRNLLFSVLIRLRSNFSFEEAEEMLTGSGSRSSAEVVTDSSVLLMGLLNVLFLEAYFPELLDKMIGFYPNEFSVLEIVYGLTKLNIRLIRRRNMNDILSRGKQCLEIIFFVFAGLCIYYSTLVQSGKTMKVAMGIVRKDSRHVEGILMLSRSAYINQPTQI